MKTFYQQYPAKNILQLAREVLPIGAEKARPILCQVKNNIFTKIYFKTNSVIYRVSVNPISYDGYEIEDGLILRRYTRSGEFVCRYVRTGSTLSKIKEGVVDVIYYYRHGNVIPGPIKDIIVGDDLFVLGWAYKDGEPVLYYIM